MSLSRTYFHTILRRRAAIVLIAGALLLLACVPMSRVLEIDVATGRTRTSYRWLWIVIKQRIEDTTFSTKFAHAAHRDVARWEIDSEFALWRRVSPHFRYHGSAQSLNSLEQALAMSTLSESQQNYVRSVSLQSLADSGPFTVGANEEQLWVTDANGAVVVTLVLPR